MSCYCDFDEGPEFFSTTSPVARRKHVCCECRGTINPGERYERSSGKWDGVFQVFKTCQRCVDFEQNITAHIPCFRRCSFGELISDAIDCLRDYKQDASALLFGAYRRLIEARRNVAERKQPTKP
jgi:hypothetical protein